MNQPAQLVKIGQLELNFLMDGTDPANPFVMFEFAIPPGAKVPVPHYHTHVDETLYGLQGITTSTVNGERIDIAKGDRLFIKRGTVHHHDNKTDLPAKTLCILTPTSININYFKELGAIIQLGVPPDPTKAAEIMERYGLIPSLG
jgi:quercetin dioxygenase-like cupin family protein